MGQSARSDVGINPLSGTEVSIVLAPVARIRGHHIGQGTGHYSYALHHWRQVFDIGRLVAHTRRHDHLMVAVHRQLAFLTLNVMPI